jgi:RNA polymerase sigma factor (sigma-70 family)
MPHTLACRLQDFIRTHLPYRDLPESILERFTAFVDKQGDLQLPCNEQTVFSWKVLHTTSTKAWKRFPVWEAGDATEIVGCFASFMNPGHDHELGVDLILELLEVMRTMESIYRYTQADVRMDCADMLVITGGDVIRLHERVRKRLYRHRKKNRLTRDSFVEALPSAEQQGRIMEIVRDALIDMPDDLRRVASLRFVNNLPIRSIAIKLKLSSRTVSSMIRRVKEKLRVALVEFAPMPGG